MALNVPARWRQNARHLGMNENSAGIAAMIAAMFLFISNDTVIKVVGQSMPVAQLLFIRGAIASALILSMAYAFGQFRRVNAATAKPLAIRCLAETAAALLYIHALMHIPLGNATAILQSLPLVLTVFAAIVLKEDVRWRRWAAIFAGFIGVLLIIRPGLEGFNQFALLAISSVFFVALRDLITRAIPRQMPTLMITFFSMAAVTLASGVIIVFGGDWTAVSIPTMGLLATAAILLIGAFYLIIVATRVGEVSTIAPYRYTILVGALFYGFIVFGEVPDVTAMMGIALIVASGLYIFARERARGVR